MFQLRHDPAPPLATPTLPASLAGPVALDAPTVRRDLTLAESMTMQGHSHGAERGMMGELEVAPL